jgi:hypothetical protein
LQNQKDIIEVISLPFRIYNQNTLSINDFVFTLSLRALKNCNIDSARRILGYSLDKDLLRKDDSKISLNFEIQPRDQLRLNWEIDLNFFEGFEMENLEPLPEIKTFEPKEIEVDIEPKIVAAKPKSTTITVQKTSKKKETKDKKKIKAKDKDKDKVRQLKLGETKKSKKDEDKKTKKQSDKKIRKLDSYFK